MSEISLKFWRIILLKFQKNFSVIPMTIFSRVRCNLRQVYYILNLSGKTFSQKFIKSPFLQTVKIKIVLSLFIFTEKSLYFIGKHIRNCFLLPDFTFNDLTTCFISETWRVLVVKHIVLTNLDHLAL